MFAQILNVSDLNRWLARDSVKLWLKRLPRMATVVVTLVLVSLAADLTWLFFTPQDTAGRAAVPSDVTARQTPEKTVRFRDIANLHLLGRASVGKGAATVRQTNIPKTNLRLTLLGVFASSEPQDSYAIIADDRKNEDFYQPGDQIQVSGRAQALLVSVHAEHVVLERNGRQEKLLLPSDPLKSAPAVQLPTRQRPQAKRETTPAPAPRNLRQVWDDFHKNPQDFWQQTRIEPVMGKDNTIQGYKLNHKDKNLMRGLGIRSTDVITSINGMPLNDPSSFAQLQGLLSELQAFSVTLLRNGKEQTLDIQP